MTKDEQFCKNTVLQYVSVIELFDGCIFLWPLRNQIMIWTLFWDNLWGASWLSEYLYTIHTSCLGCAGSILTLTLLFLVNTLIISTPDHPCQGHVFIHLALFGISWMQMVSFSPRILAINCPSLNGVSTYFRSWNQTYRGAWYAS